MAWYGIVWYDMVELCEGAPVAVSGWVLTDRHDHVIVKGIRRGPQPKPSDLKLMLSRVPPSFVIVIDTLNVKSTHCVIHKT